MSENINIAVLIDGDNVPSANVKEMMEEIAKYGNPTIKRIYGDWTKPHLNKWKKILLENAITPIQSYSYTIGKNSTDSAMIIDAMDILQVKPYGDTNRSFTRGRLQIGEGGGLGKRSVLCQSGWWREKHQQQGHKA